MKEWITISITPPKVGTPIVLRTENKFDLGYSYMTIDYSDKFFDQEEYEASFVGGDYVEWMDIS